MAMTLVTVIGNDGDPSPSSQLGRPLPNASYRQQSDIGWEKKRKKLNFNIFPMMIDFVLNVTFQLYLKHLETEIHPWKVR